LLPLAQEKNLIDEARRQCRFIILALTKDVSVQLHAAHQERDIALSNPQAIGFETLAADELCDRCQLEVVSLENLRQRADHELQVSWRKHRRAGQGTNVLDRRESPFESCPR
jgi:hypothetical protein